jgi:predicted permease
MGTLRFVARQLRRNATFTAVVVLSLAVGIGANAALFSLVDAMVLKKLPVADPDTLVYLEWSFTGRLSDVSVNGNLSIDAATNTLTATSFAYATYENIRASSRSLRDVFAFAPTYRSIVSVDGLSETLPSQLVSGNYFASLGVRAQVGRMITDADDAQTSPVAVISDRYWARRFARDPGVIGKTIALNGKALTIIGVLPAGFLGTQDFGQPADISYPLSLEAELQQLTPAMRSPRGWWLRIMGRLARGVAHEQAQGELQALFAAPLPEDQRPALRVRSAARGYADGFRNPEQYLWPLAGISLVLLAIVCLNVANLMVARMAARTREIGMRFALGARRSRVIALLLVEALVLACMGGALGAVLAHWAKDALITVLPQSSYRFYELVIDERVLAFAVAASIVAGLLFALLPVRGATRPETVAIRGTVRTTTRGYARVSRALLVTQVAMSVALLVSAGALVQTVRNLQAVDVGFRTDGLLLFDVSPGDQRYDLGRTNALYRQLVDGVDDLPGTESVTFASYPLVANSGAYRSVALEGNDSPAIARVGILRVRDNFFDTIGMPILAGRDFNSTDVDGAPKVAVVNEALAREIEGGDALGRRLFFDFGRPDLDQRVEIVGIVGIVKNVSALPSRSEPVPVVYLPEQQSFVGGQLLSRVTFMVRTTGEPLTMAAAIRVRAREIDPNIPLVDLRSQTEQISRGFSTEIALATAATTFGIVAMLLASIGLFGLLMYNVGQRKREIGIRMAVGARSGNVVALVMRQTFTLVASGVAAGICTAVVLGRMLESVSSKLLFGVAPHDPLILTAAAAAMVIVAAAAAYLPARAAAHVDPTVTLREE